MKDREKFITEFKNAPKVRLLSPNEVSPLEKKQTTLGVNYTTNSSRTISISEKSWKKAFKKLTGQSHPIPSALDAAGIYCFWLLTGQNKYGENAGARTHWLQGKQYNETLDKHRLDPTCQLIGKGTKADGEPTAKDHIFHKVTWHFDNTHEPIPLYIGKTSNLFNRLKLHLSWPASFEQSATVELTDPTIKNSKAVHRTVRKNNTSTQFRSCFEYLHRPAKYRGLGVNAEDENAHYYRIGLSILPSSFANVAKRFYHEDLLVGALKPPFNVDSER
jgi:hypothetical protein